MKEKDKELLTNEFRQYLTKNNLIYEYNSRAFSVKYIIHKNAENKVQPEHSLKDFINETYSRISGTHHLFNFLSKLLTTKETQSLAVAYLKEKEPGNNSYEYEEYRKNAINILTPYKTALYEYVNRKKFLEKNYDDLETYFKTIATAEERENIINTCLVLKTFKENVDTQTSIYNLIQKNIKNNKKYDEYFPNIKKIDEEQDLFMSSTHEEVVKYRLDLTTLNSLNLNKEYGIGGLKNYIKVLSRKFNEMIEENTLHINATTTEIKEIESKNEHQIEFRIYGQSLDKLRLNYFMNFLCKDLFYSDKIDISDEKIKSALVKADKMKLAHTLDKEVPEASHRSNRYKV